MNFKKAEFKEELLLWVELDCTCALNEVAADSLFLSLNISKTFFLTPKDRNIIKTCQDLITALINQVIDCYKPPWHNERS